MNWSPKQIEAIERRRIAVHEAGHVIIARHLGVGAQAIIHPNPVPSEDEKSWLGKTFLSDFPNRKAGRMIGVAGVVAEHLWGGQNIHDLDFEDPDVMSWTDWKGTGCEPGKPDNDLYKAANRVAWLLQKPNRWTKLCLEARSLIRAA